MESCVLVTITVTVFFLCALVKDSCVPADDKDFLMQKDIEVKNFNCPEGSYSRLATLLFDAQSNTIKTFMS